MANASCHLFDPATNRDVAAYKLTGTKMLDKKTALIMALLHRDAATAAAPNGEWCLRVTREHEPNRAPPPPQPWRHTDALQPRTPFPLRDAVSRQQSGVPRPVPSSPHCGRMWFVPCDPLPASFV